MKKEIDEFVGYKISRAYKRVTMWSFSKHSNHLLHTGICIPDKELNKKQRYEVIAKRLQPILGFKLPYNEKK